MDEESILSCSSSELKDCIADLKEQEPSEIKEQTADPVLQEDPIGKYSAIGDNSEEEETQETEPLDEVVKSHCDSDYIHDNSYQDISDEEISTNKEKHCRLGAEDLNDTLEYDFSELQCCLLMLEAYKIKKAQDLEITSLRETLGLSGD